MERLTNLLKFVRLVDEDSNHVSLINLTVMICIVKLAITPELSIHDIGALCVALFGYQAHRNSREKNKEDSKSSERDARHAELATEVQALKSKVNAMSIANIGGRRNA